VNAPKSARSLLLAPAHAAYAAWAVLAFLAVGLSALLLLVVLPGG